MLMRLNSSIAMLLLIVIVAAALLSLTCFANTSDEHRVFLPMTTKSAQLTTNPNQRLYGVLQPDPKYHTSTWNAGVRILTLELGWNHYQPQSGSWNTAYAQEQQQKLEQMRRAGFQVVLDFGIQYPPEWAKNIRPWKDQYGNTYRDQVNAVWSPVVRQHIEAYIHRVFQDLGTNFWGVRLGSGGWVETLYPDTAPGFQFSYWAFDDDANSSNPVPNWRPGQPSPDDEARRFYTWYLQHLIDTVNWQQDVVRRDFGGYLIQLLPGQGLRPSQWETLIATNLIPTGKHIFAAERGAVWDKLLDGMRNRHNVVIDCSSIADASSTSPYTNETATDSIYWSSAHWVAHNADKYGLLKIAENPGRSDYQNMKVTFQQMRDFGYSALFWAFEPDLYNGQYATINQYSDLIKQYQ